MPEARGVCADSSSFDRGRWPHTRAISSRVIALQLLGREAPALAVYHRSPLRSPAPGIALRAMPHNALAAAQQLFSDLRDLDALGVPLIWVEAPPESADWEGVRDRLERAAAAG